MRNFLKDIAFGLLIMTGCVAVIIALFADFPTADNTFFLLFGWFVFWVVDKLY